ncbi:MAG: PadR family transcriptional regulator [Chloroflexota bacterium]|nr:MAG: PadR family transcriptional regulator [Chloroflexota bacterium]
MSRPKQPLGPTEFAVLGLLTLKPCHGYELASLFAADADLGLVCHAHISVLYASLRALEGLGYVYAETEAPSSYPPRKTYHLTPLGQTAFRRWLDEPVHRIRQIRLDFLLKLYFSGLLTDHDTVGLIEAQIAACRTYLTELQTALAGTPSDGFRRLVLRSKINAAESTMDWLDRQRQEWAEHMAQRMPL